MSINEDAIRLLAELRVEIAHTVDTETRALVRAWARAWDEVAAEWDAVTAQITAARAAGEHVSAATIRRMQRAANAVTTTHTQLVELVNQSAARVTTSTGQLLDVTLMLDERITLAQLPPVFPANTAATAINWTRVNPDAVAAIVERTTQQITSRAWPLADDATEAMLRELVRSIPEGQSPRVAARRMLRAVEGRFNGGLPRATTIARTEIIDAYRTAAFQQQNRNRDVMAGWVWLAALDERTCPACVAMHGTEHSITTPGPIGHQNCRCSRMPVTKTWAELGFDIPEPASTVMTGEDWFNRQSESVKLQIMGQARLDALADGVPFAELATRRSNPGWRDSINATPTTQLAA